MGKNPPERKEVSGLHLVPLHLPDVGQQLYSDEEGLARALTR